MYIIEQKEGEREKNGEKNREREKGVTKRVRDR